MNRAPHDSGDDDSRRRAVKLNMAAARLDVFRHERLGYTEIPVMSSLAIGYRLLHAQRARVAQSSERDASNIGDEGGSPSVSANSLTLNERKSYETCYSLSKSVALSQELQTKSDYSNPTGAEAERHVPPHTCRSSDQNV